MLRDLVLWLIGSNLGPRVGVLGNLGPLGVPGSIRECWVLLGMYPSNMGVWGRVWVLRV